MTECRTVSISIQRTPDDVYTYLLDAATFPQWSAFITAMEREGESWRAKTPRGTLHIQFAPRNPYRVLDHTVTTADGTRVHVPMRVVPNGSADSEVMLSVFRQPDMSDEQYLADIKVVTEDLASLKRVIER